MADLTLFITREGAARQSDALDFVPISKEDNDDNAFLQQKL
jgi:hypothetical protein